MSSKKDRESGVIFRPYITLKNGKRLYASQVGLKAFPIKVKSDEGKAGK